MASKKEILDQIAALQAEADSMGDGDEEYEVEIWGSGGEGARLPHSRAEPWLRSRFPELFPEAPAEDPEPDPANPAKPPKTKASPGGTQPQTRSNTATRYFTKRPAGK